MFPLYSYQLFVWNSMKLLHDYDFIRNFILPIFPITLVLGGLFSLKTLLQESSLARAKHVWPTVQFAGKLLCIRRSWKQHLRCWPLIGHKNIFCAQSQINIRMSCGTGLLRGVSQGLSHPFLKTFTAIIPDPNDPPPRVSDGGYDTGVYKSFFVKNIGWIIICSYPFT